MTQKLEIPTARAFLPLLSPKRFKGAKGGRGSGKSHFFAELLVEYHTRFPGMRSVCVREIQKSLRDSSKQLVEGKIQALGLGSKFNVLQDRIETPGNGSILFQGMQDHTAETIKSLEGCRVAWVEEAQMLSERSLSLLRPTIRWEDQETKEGSEIWFSWNPTRKGDAVEKFFGLLKDDPDAVVVTANWRDNPWFPEVLEKERQLELKHYPDRYPHTWEGEFASAFEGAYFASLLGEAKRDGRISRVAADPLLPIRAFMDIGGAGATADAFVIWIVQFVGQEIRVLDYYEAVGQVLAEHVQWLRDRKYDKAICHLPHDGVNANNITGKQYKDHLAEAGFDVPLPTPNQGRGASSLRIEAVRRIMPKCWFNDTTTEAGRIALGFYHERRDSDRNVGLGPEHDWSSHAADAFGLMAISYEEPSRAKSFNRVIEYPQLGVV